jgi:hypothetical protein
MILAIAAVGVALVGMVAVICCAVGAEAEKRLDAVEELAADERQIA